MHAWIHLFIHTYSMRIHVLHVCVCMCVCFYVCVWCVFSRSEDASLRLYASYLCQPPPKLESPHPIFVFFMPTPSQTWISTPDIRDTRTAHTVHTMYRTLYTFTIHTVNTHIHTHTLTPHMYTNINIETHILARLPLSFFCTLTAGSLAIPEKGGFFTCFHFCFWREQGEKMSLARTVV
jgi:hypothetical protein